MRFKSMLIFLIVVPFVSSTDSFQNQFLNFVYNGRQYSLEIYSPDKSNGNNCSAIVSYLYPLFLVNTSHIKCSTDLILRVPYLQINVLLWNEEYKETALIELQDHFNCNNHSSKVKMINSVSIHEVNDLKAFWSVLPPTSQIQNLPLISDDLINVNGQPKEISLFFYPKDNIHCYKLRRYFSAEKSNVYNLLNIEYKFGGKTDKKIVKLRQISTETSKMPVKHKYEFMKLDERNKKQLVQILRKVNETELKLVQSNDKIDHLYRAFHTFQSDTFVREKHQRILNTNAIGRMKSTISMQICRNVTLSESINRTKMGWLYLKAECNPLEWIQFWNKKYATCCKFKFV